MATEPDKPKRGQRFRTRVLRHSVEAKKARDAAAEGDAPKPVAATNLDFVYQGKRPAESSVGIDPKRGGLLLLVGATSALLFVFMILTREDPRRATTTARPRSTRRTSKRAAPQREVAMDPVPSERAAPRVELQDNPALAATENRGVNESHLISAELLARSRWHRALGRLLLDYDALRADKPKRGGENSLLDFQERRRREQLLLQQVRDLGDEALPAMVDLIKHLRGHGFQLFLANAMAGMDSPAALAATADLLTNFDNDNVRMTLVRNLPNNPESTELIARAVKGLKNANLRVRVLREYANRTRADASGDIVELLREIAMNDPSPQARAEAITIIGRRKLVGEREILEDIVRKGGHPTVRQRAILSLASTAGIESISTLSGVLNDASADERVRASTILALSTLGPEAIPALEAVARDDESETIRRRARTAVESIRLTLKRKAERQSMQHNEDAPFEQPR